MMPLPGGDMAHALRVERNKFRDAAALAALPAVIAARVPDVSIEEIAKLSFMFGEAAAQRRDQLNAEGELK